MDEPIEGQVKCPNPHGIEPTLSDHLFDYSSRLPDTGAGEPCDLVQEVVARQFSGVAAYEELLRNEELWPDDVRRRLAVVIRACESVGIAYRIHNQDREAASEPVSIRHVVIELSGPDS